MGKSNYPNELDTSVEIPSVRDNITEIGSDVINSLRSAIFNIERTLGINPQGSIGNTVASRLEQTLDQSGNIKSEALQLANVLSGPVLDADVSSVAAIKETKLRLDFPTKLLQSEISTLDSQLDSIIEQIGELSITLSTHLNSSAVNRHPATAISVDSASAAASDIASLSLESEDLQDILEEIYNAHINYSGNNISALNNSHSAAQIYYNNEQTSDLVLSDSVQGAIDDLALSENAGFRESLLNLHSNGRIRTGTVTDDFENPEKGSQLLVPSSATYIQSTGSTTTFTPSGSITPTDTISEFDILTLSGSVTDGDNKEYQISSVTIDGSGFLTSVDVYGGPKGEPTTGLLIEITRSQYVTYNSNGFNCSARPRSNKSNIPDVQVANPDCAVIISSGFNAADVTSTVHAFDLVIDGNDPVTIETYDSTATEQSIDSVINKINEQAVDLHLNFAAFKLRRTNCYEVALSHTMPNVSVDVINRTLEIQTGSSDDGTSILGFSDLLDQEVEGATGNSVNINGRVLSGFGLIQAYTSSTLSLVEGAVSLSLSSGSFIESGIRVGDFAIVTNSSESSDDGTYRVGSVTDSSIDLDLSGGSFSGNMLDNEDARVFIVRATVPVGELTFSEIASSDGAILFDTFISEEKDYFFKKRLEIEGSLKSATFFAGISDVSKDFIIGGQVATVSVDTDGLASLTGPDLLVGESIFVSATGRYRLPAADGLSFVIMDVQATGNPAIPQSVTLFGFDEIKTSNYRLCRGLFATSLGRVLGTSIDTGVPLITDRRVSGTVDSTIIGDTFIEKFIEGPRNELRASGIIRGCELSSPVYVSGSPDFQTFSISVGVFVANGIRFEFSGVDTFRVNTSDDYIVAFDNRGCVVAAPLVDNGSDLISPFAENEVANVAFVENDGSTATTTDLRLFVDNLDLKVIGDVKVANDSRHGHFTDIATAVKYAKHFNKMFPDMSPPSIYIEPGSYSITEQILVDFDVLISGAGPDTKIFKTGSLASGTPLVGNRVDVGTGAFLIGGGSDSEADDIIRGVTLKNFTYLSNVSLLTNVGCAIALTQPEVKSAVSVSDRATYRFENINFLGPATINGVLADPNKVGEYALVLGQQDSGTLIPTPDVEISNITIKDCRFDQIGVERGAVKLLESSGGVYRNIIASGNIATKTSPNLVDATNIIIEYPTTPTLEQVDEPNNIVRLT